MKIIRRSPSASWREIDGQVVVISIDVSRVRLLNKVAGFVWSRCDGRGVDEMVAEVSQRYGVGQDMARRDIDTFVSDLVSRGMLVLEG